MSELPKGWAAERLGRIAEINPPQPTVSIDDDDMVSFIPMAKVQAESGFIDTPDVRPWAEVKKGYTRFQDGDLLFAKITPCMENGKIAIAKELRGGVGTGSTEFHVIRSPQGFRGEYLFYYLLQREVRRNARLEMKGAAGQLRVPASFLENLELPIAPAPEQDRIVAEIEKQFTRLDAATGALNRVQANLKRYRASVLKAACEGRLVTTEAELARKESRDYEPASKLLKRILHERRVRWEANSLARAIAGGKLLTDDSWKHKYKEPAVPDTASLPDLPEGWCWATIDQVAECLDSQRVPVNKDERARRLGDVPYYGANGQVGWIDDYLFDEPLVLVVEDETFVGRQIPFSYLIAGKSWVNNHAHILRARSGVATEFLNYSLSYYPFTQLTTGSTGRRKLTQKALMEAPYALPPLAEQARIVSEIARLLSLEDSIEEQLSAALKRGGTLRQAALRSAFLGRLVPQNVIDEPASALLRRIRAERAEASKRPSRRRTNSGLVHA